MSEKPSLKNRIRCLLNFATINNDKTLYELTAFVSCKMGLFDIIEREIILVKKEKINNLEKQIITNVYSDTKKLLVKPAYLVEFNINASQLWKSPFAEVTNTKNIYFFRLSQAGLSKKISQIDLVK